MTGWAIRALRSILLGIASGGAAFLMVWLLGALVPAKVHAWGLLTVAALFAISESHFTGLLSELSALLRRGTYSVRQLEELNQIVPEWRRKVSLVLTLSMWLKAGVGLACVLLLWDGLPRDYVPVAMFAGYACFFLFIAFAIWGRRNFRKLEKAVDDLNIKEASIKEKRMRSPRT